MIHAQLFHTKRFCFLIFQLTAASCVAALLVFILYHLNLDELTLRFWRPAPPVAAITWMVAVISNQMKDHDHCGSMLDPLFWLKISKVHVLLMTSLLWLGAHCIVVAFLSRSGFDLRGAGIAVFVTTFLSMGAPFFILLVSGAAQKIQDDMQLVTSENISEGALAAKSNDELKHLWQLSLDMSEETNATLISRRMVCKS